MENERNDILVFLKYTKICWLDMPIHVSWGGVGNLEATELTISHLPILKQQI